MNLVTKSMYFEWTTRARSARWRLPNIDPGTVASIVLLLIASFWWIYSLDYIELQRMDDTGLISVLPVLTLIALVLVNASFCLAIVRRPVPVALILVQIIVLIFMLYGITALVQEVPRFAIGWKLAGIIDYVIQTGTVDGRIDAFFNWPTFYILVASITEIMGFDSAVSFMQWAPVFFNLLYLGPLWLIFRSATADRRLIALGLWFFYLGNWIGQDYLAPQAFAYFLFLVVVAVILTWMRGSAWPTDALITRLRAKSNRLDRLTARVERWLEGRERPTAPATPIQRGALVGVIVLILMAMVSEHQLTPFALLGGMCALIFFNRFSAITLPILFAVLIATWVLFMATPYISGHIEHVSGPVGSVGTNIDANLTERFRGSPGHIFINYIRTGMSLSVWGLAFLGMLRRLRNGYRDWGLILLAGTPFPLLALQAYGGELLLRIYLYSVPFMAFFGAALFFTSPRLGRSLFANLMLYATCVLLLVGFLFARYGNERMTYFTADEVDAVEFLYETAAPGSQLVALTGTLPWRYQDYRTYKYTTVPRLTRTQDIDALIGIMADRKYPASYLILTRSQQASGELFIGWPPGTWEAFVTALQESGRFHPIYANHNASVFVMERTK